MRDRPNTMLPAVAALLVLAAAACPLRADPEAMLPLPAPTGPSPVGTTVHYLVDARRSDADFPRGRPITLQLWYPAARRDGAPAPYLVERALPRLLHDVQYYGVDSTTLDAWAHLVTHARTDAPPAPGRHPLIAFSVGLGVIRANYTTLAEELASRGYVVALVENPLLGAMALPDGGVVVDTVGRFGDPAAHARAVDAWAGDVVFALDRLAGARGASALAAVARRVDWTRVGAAGHSTGGLVAIAAAERDRRVRAAVDLDGGLVAPDGKPLASFVERGPRAPTLFLQSQPLYDDSTLARRGLTRAQWVERGRAGRVALEALLARAPGRCLVAHVAGTGHFSFSDAPFVMPSAITRFGGRIIDARRGLAVVTGAIGAFFEAAWAGRPGGLDALAGHSPELTVDPPARQPVPPG